MNLSKKEWVSLLTFCAVCAVLLAFNVLVGP